jgi:retinol dehydrogenase 12
MIPDPKALTVEGYDLQFGVNVVGECFHGFVASPLTILVGPYYFTHLLIPQLEAASSSRIVTLSSHGHILVDGINWDTVRDGPARQKAKPLDLYNQSKFVGQFLAIIRFAHWLLQADVVFAREFARRYADKGVVSMSVHPGRPHLLVSLV